MTDNMRISTIYFDNTRPAAKGGDLYARGGLVADLHAKQPWYAPEPSTTTKAETGYTFYPDQTLANEAARAQIFMADMLAWMILAVLVAGAVLWIRDIVRYLRGRIHRARN